MATFELYRASTIGRSLIKALDEMIESSKLSLDDAIRVLLQFDQSIAEAFKTQVKGKVRFTGDLHMYRYCDSVWTFNLRNAVFEIHESRKQAKNGESQKQEDVARMKIVACDSKLLLL